MNLDGRFGLAELLRSLPLNLVRSDDMGPRYGAVGWRFQLASPLDIRINSFAGSTPEALVTLAAIVEGVRSVDTRGVKVVLELPVDEGDHFISRSWIQATQLQQIVNGRWN